MRIDQYLWCIRIFKSRSIASQVCKKGQVQINGQSVKPSREILPMDIIKIRKEQIWRTFQVLDIPKSRVGAKLVALYAVDQTDKYECENQKLQKLSSPMLRDQGTGRPTKKDRRDIEDLHISRNSEDL